MVRLAGHISVPSGGGVAALRALLQEPEWSDQDCYGLGYVDGPLVGRRRGLGRWGPKERMDAEWSRRGNSGYVGCLHERKVGQGGCQGLGGRHRYSEWRLLHKPHGQTQWVSGLGW